MVDLLRVDEPESAPQQLANSMLGALLAVVHQAGGDGAVGRVLETAGETRSHEELRLPGGWSTYEQGLALFRAASTVLDDPDIGRKAGAEVFRQYAGTEVLAILRSMGSPTELVRAYPAISAKQSTITQAEVTEVGDTHGVIRVVSPDHERNPLFCGYTIGALSQFPVLFGMEPAEVTEPECQTRGDGHCTVRVQWDPSSSIELNLERQVELLREQVLVLTSRFESLESVAKDLSSMRDVDSLLETVTRRAGVAVRAPRYLLVATLPGESRPRVHHVGFSEREAALAADEVLGCDPSAVDRFRLVVDIASSRGSLGRLAAFFPETYHFLPQERSLLMAYAGHAAAALETAAAMDEARDRNATLGALLALGKALSEEPTKLDLAERLVHGVIEIIDCDEAHMLLWDAGDALLTRAAVAPSASEPSPRRSVRDAGMARWLMSLSGPHVISTTSDPAASAVLAITGQPAGMVVPITARNVLFGALVVGSRHGHVSPDQSTRERLAGVASLAATALEGVTLLDEVRHQALHDPITDLANSRLFEDRVTHALSMSRRTNNALAFLFVDLDRFKAVNDSYGHTVGDALLKEVAERLLALTRAEDTVARIGGDEFGLLISQVHGRGDAELVAQKIVAAVGAPFVVRGISLLIGASVGVTTLPELGDTYDTVLARADSAMYRAKAEGRGRYHTHDAVTPGQTADARSS